MGGCGRKFLHEFWLSKIDRTFQKGTEKRFIFCGDNLSNTLCPQCKSKKDVLVATDEGGKDD